MLGITFQAFVRLFAFVLSVWGWPFEKTVPNTLRLRISLPTKIIKTIQEALESGIKSKEACYTTNQRRAEKVWVNSIKDNFSERTFILIKEIISNSDPS